MLTLYYFKGACSLVPHIALEWVDVPYEIKALSREELKSPEYLKINPMGAVPCLKDDDFVVTQNVAILEYLDDLFPKSKLLGGATAKQRADGRRWLAIMNSDLHPTFGYIFGGARMVQEEEGQKELRAFAEKRIKEIYAICDKQLDGKQYLTGYKSVADAYLFATLGWAKNLGIDISEFKNLVKFKEEFAQDEGVKAAMAAE